MMVAGAAMVGGMWAAAPKDQANGQGQADGQSQAEHQPPTSETGHVNAPTARERQILQDDQRIQRLDQIASVLRDEDFPELAEQADWQARRLEGRIQRDLQQHQLDQVESDQKALRRQIEQLREEVLQLRRAARERQE